MERNNNKTWPLILVVMIGLILIIYGIIQIAKTFNYVETVGHFSHSEKSSSPPSNPIYNKGRSYYIWCYNFYINNEKYTSFSDPKEIEKPSDMEEIVMYNPNNPAENILGTDYSRYNIIIVGIIFILTYRLFSFKQNTNNYDNLTNKTDSNLVTWFILLFSGGCLFILLARVNFRINILLSTLFLPTIALLVLLFLGLILLKNTYLSRKTTDYNSNDKD